MNLEAHIIEPVSKHRASIIWLHGLGADGYDFAPVAEALALSEVLGLKFIFPHAPVRPITVNQGYPMRGWYDIVTLDRDNFVHDLKGVEASSRFVHALIESEHAKGIPYERIILAGFSQGGAISLFAGLTWPHALAGILALSTYVPAPEVLFERHSSVERAIFMAHGTHDDIISIEYALLSLEWLKKMKQSPVFHQYPIGHSLCQEEVLDIGAWIKKSLS